MNYIENVNFSYSTSQDGQRFIDNKLEIIHIVDFDEGSLCQFIDGCHAALNSGAEYLPIEVDSYGGEVDALNGMLSYIDDFKNRGIKVITFCATKAMSCGSVLLSAGTKGYRFMSPRAHLMIHEVSGADFGKLADMKSSVRHQDQLNKELFDQLDINAGKESGYFEALCKQNKNADLYLTAEQCLAHGLVDFIGIPSLVLTVKPQYELIFPKELNKKNEYKEVKVS